MGHPGDGVNDFAVDGADSLGRGTTGIWYYAGKQRRAAEDVMAALIAVSCADDTEDVPSGA